MIEIGLDTEMYRLGTSWFSLITKYQKDKTVTYGQYKKCRLRFYRKSHHYEFFFGGSRCGFTLSLNRV